MGRRQQTRSLRTYWDAYPWSSMNHWEWPGQEAWRLALFHKFGLSNLTQEVAGLSSMSIRLLRWCMKYALHLSTGAYRNVRGTCDHLWVAWLQVIASAHPCMQVTCKSIGLTPRLLPTSLYLEGILAGIITIQQPAMRIANKYSKLYISWHNT